ncbi:Imm50 family immunity protein [Streptomyces sp. NPDC051582]|uniref:Imm50 family immunity protein n=1 Tax=Streptomyces sp. NPDC051582 TaxID=3155167 RepID=UPI0034322D48
MSARTGLAALYEVPPELGSCDLYDVHIDERDTSVTFGFETASLPDHPLPEWGEPGAAYNTLYFTLVFTGVRDLRISGIRAEAEHEVRITGTAPGRVEVAMAGGTRSIRFSAAGSRVTRVRVGLRGAP